MGQCGTCVACPVVEQGLHNLPAGHHIVSPLKQRGIPNHAVVDQGFVACTGRILEIVLVMKIHVYLTNRNIWPRNFCAKHQRCALIGLQLEHQRIGR